VSLINCAFALDSYELDECGWVCLSDIQSKKELNKLLAHDPDGKVYSKKNIESVLNQEYSPKVNTWVAQRMAWQGYVDNEFKGGMERRHYYGPLECLNDKAEYCVEICNRESIIRMEEYDGIRPVRIATINTIDVEPLGNGMYDMFRPLLSKIDDAESALLNMITLAGANMYAKQKSLSDEDTEFAIRQFGVMSLENPNLNPISPDPNNLSAIAGYTADQIQKFRQASGATDTLQAIVPADQATATSVSLAMNESVRNLSVTAQTIAPTLVQDHIRVVLQNEQMYNTEPFVLNIGGAPITVVPADLLLDVNVRIKTVTDQDFRPARLQRIREGIQLMGMFGPNAIPGKKVNPGPAILEYLKILDIPNYQDTIQDISEEDLLNMRLAADMGMPAPEGGAVGGGPMPAPSKSTITTPVGEVLAAPGDNTETTAAVRNSSVNK
jgi:hypothetical protein